MFIYDIGSQSHMRRHMLILQNRNQFRKREKKLLVNDPEKPLLRLSPRNNLLMNVNWCFQLTYHPGQYISHIGWKYELNH